MKQLYKHFFGILIIIFSLNYLQAQTFEILTPVSYSRVFETSPNQYIACGSSSGSVYLLKIDENFDTVLASSPMEQGKSILQTNLFYNHNKQLVLFYHVFEKDTLNIVTEKLMFAYIDENLNLYNNKEYEITPEIGTISYVPTFLLDQDNTIIMGVNTTDSLGFSKGKYFLKFDLMLDTLSSMIYNKTVEYNNITFNSDSTLIYLWDSHCVRTILTKDFEVIQEDELSDGIPYMGLYSNILEDYFQNPHNGYIYISFENTFHPDNTGTHPDFSVMKIDDEKNILGLYLRDHTPTYDMTVRSSSLSFSNNETIFGISYFDFSFYYNCQALICAFDENLNLKKELFYSGISHNFLPLHILATSDNGCIITGRCSDINHQYQGSLITKFPAEVFVSIEEAHNNGLAVAVAYPNPGSERLCIRTTVPKAELEVFDMMGRTVAKQIISETETAVNTTIWQAGTYLWRVYSEGKVAETGKWVKR